MKNKLMILLLPFLVLSLSGWLWGKKESENPIEGKWKPVKAAYQNVTVLFDPTGLFKTTLGDNKENDIFGDYYVMSDRLIIQDNVSISETSCKDKGFYDFRIVQGELWLTLVADACVPRKDILPGRWERIVPDRISTKNSKVKKAEQDPIAH
jgi:hypothetical protein